MASKIFLLLLLLMGAALSEACKSSPPKTVSKKSIDEGSDEDSPDETSDDIAVDSEDFDLICDSHVSPPRAQRLPDVVIVGAKKGGTRALIEFLKLHPLLKAAGPEIHFFDKHFEEGLDWYRSRMPPVTEAQLAMEKTPGYFHVPGCPQRIKTSLPGAKLLLIVRDPVSRLVSDYNQFRSRNLDEGKDYPALESLVFKEDGSVNEKYPPVQRSIYAQHMERWMQHYGQEKLMIVHGEKFISEPWAELQRVESWLGLEPVITEEHFFFNGTKGFYCGKETRTTGVWECVKRKCLSRTKGRPKPPLQPDTRPRLTRYFTPHNERFYELVGRDFGWPRVDEKTKNAANETIAVRKVEN